MRHTPVILLCAIILAAGCSTAPGPGKHAGDTYIVNSHGTLFYTYGPAQATGPDFTLSNGQRVTMLNYQYGYSRVTVQGTGQSGYVPTEDLVAAPPAFLPGPAAFPAPSRGHRRQSEDSRPPTPDEESQIPLPSFPESQPPPGSPAFRY